MERRKFLKTLGGLPAASALLSAADAGRPNIVFILTDDQRWDEMSIAGHPFLKTPNMDRVGREGVLFKNCFVSIPLCSPSRASFLTGKYPHSHKIFDNTNRSERSYELITYLLLMQRAGYETGYVGKWHMGNDDSPRPGFNRWVSFRGQGQYIDPLLNIDGKQVKNEGYMTDLLNGHAVDFLKQKHEKPFLLYVAHKAVHGPFTPAERHKNLYSDQPIARAPNAKDTLEGKPNLQRKIEKAPQPGPGTGSPDDLIRNQMRALMAVDEGVGQILKTLEETGQLDKTFVIFTSDNGYFWGEHGLGDKRAAYEESIRIPLLIRYPKLIKAGSVREQMALNIDIAPTVLQLAGLPVPRDMHGRSLLPVLRSEKARLRTSFLTEYYMEQQTPRFPTWQAARTEQWKYIHYIDPPGAPDSLDELYDIKADPYEMKNLIGDPKLAATLKRMKQELRKLVRTTP
ncbi:MAG: DUF4976 domain-containing protein [Bryobacterales bacterium]|nr:DUF4976 domain-containing protein [Bryobacterales bacterium]